MSEPREPHLSGIDLEALAAGDGIETPAAQHLASCPQCRAALSAMRDENRLFAAELAAPATQELIMPAVANARRSKSPKVTLLPQQSHKPLVFYAVAASIMLVAALGLIYYGKQPDKAASGANPQVADRSQAPLGKTADDKDKPGEANPAENEPTYEGSTAAQWVAQLKKELAENKQLSPLGTKAVHALVELGRDALPQVLELARTPGDTYLDTADSIVRKMKLEKADIQLLADGLKAKDYATRLAAVNLLGGYGHSHPEAAETAKAALEPMLHDRDKAVVEATRNELAALTETPQFFGPAGPAAIPLNDTANAAQVYGPADGRVLAIKNDIGLVMLSIGTKDGVKAGSEYAIRRNTELIAKVRIEKVYPDMSSAKVLQDAKNKAIQINDGVVPETNANSSTPDEANKEADAEKVIKFGYPRMTSKDLLALKDFMKRYPASMASARAQELLQQMEELQAKLREQPQLDALSSRTIVTDKEKPWIPERSAETEADLRGVLRELQAALNQMRVGVKQPDDGIIPKELPPQMEQKQEIDTLKQDIEKLRGQMRKAAPDAKTPEPVKKEEKKDEF